MLEAMACGTPVAAYPVDGPLEVLRDPVHGDQADKRQGGVLGEDLSQASLAALKIPREEAYAQAQTFSWKESTRLFESHLVRLSR
jgi:glycosyltransferase involved in cell wall biosynthesis